MTICTANIYIVTRVKLKNENEIIYYNSLGLVNFKIQSIIPS